MKHEVVARGFELTPFIEQHVDRQLHHLLAWNWRKIKHIRVIVGDSNGPRGGVDKYCNITVDLTSGHTIRVEKAATDLYRAITLAAATAEKAAVDTIARQRSRGRRSLGLLF